MQPLDPTSGFCREKLERVLPRETVRKGVRVASEASILVVSSNEIELLGPVSAVFEASVQSLSGLFGQSLSAIW